MSLMIFTAGIVREFPPAMGDFIQHGGVELLVHCLSCDHDKLIIKALFLLTSIASGISNHINGQLSWCVSLVHAVEHYCNPPTINIY